MSLDFPKRADWLKVRSAAPRPIKYLHLSTRVVEVPLVSKGVQLVNEDGTPASRKVMVGVTFRESKKGPARKARRVAKFNRRYGIAA